MFYKDENKLAENANCKICKLRSEFTSLTVLIELDQGFASSTSFDNTDMDDIQVCQMFKKARPFFCL